MTIFFEKPTSHSRKIDLGLEGEDSKGEGDGGADPYGHEDLVRPVPGGDGAQHEALGQGEQEEEDEVVWGLPPDALAAGESDQRDEHDDHGEDPHLGVLGGVELDTLHGEDADNGHSDDKLKKGRSFLKFIVIKTHLDTENRVNLPDESKSDRLLSEGVCESTIFSILGLLRWEKCKNLTIHKLFKILTYAGGAEAP